MHQVARSSGLTLQRRNGRGTVVDVSDEEVIGCWAAYLQVVARRLGRRAVERSMDVHGKSLGLVLAPWLVVCEASVC